MNRRAARWFALLILVAGAIGPLVPTAGAQYFGRNKVRYEDFDYKILRTEHFDIYYYPEEREAVQQAALLAERWYTRLTRFFGHEFRDRQPLVLYASQSHFQQTTVLSGDIGEGTGGATEALRRRIVLPFAGLLSETDHVIGHELVHAFQFDITTRGNVRAGGAPPGALYLPLWFIEGMAEYVSLGPIDPNTAMWLRDATIANRLPTLAQLDNPRVFPYRYGQAFWAYVGGRYGDAVVGELLRVAAQAGDWRPAIPRVLGIGLDSLSAQWHAALHELYDPIASRTKGPAAFGAVALPTENQRALTLAPVLSPDGSRMAFISERNRTSIELFVADVATGKVRKKLTKAAVDPHLESLQFITSAGSWAPDGRRFAYAAVSRGEPLLAVVDVERGRTLVERSFHELDQIFNPTWSPDGRWIALSASVGGQLDLFAYDLEEKTLQRLTNDVYGELHPAWSPDGRSIAFATDRFSTDLDKLVFGEPQLALLDRATGAVRSLPGFRGAKHTNPQWGPDGRSLFFLSDRGGITDVYRLDLETGGLFQLTTLQTGVSGITGLSPALSAAQRSGRLAFSVFEQRRYHIYGMDSATAAAGQPVTEPVVAATAAALPPVERVSDEVLTLLADPEIGLPADREFVERKYSPKLGLEYLAPPSVAAGVDQFGTFIGGSTALFWSDVLGTRSLVTSFAVNGRIDEFAGLVGYTNQRRRLAWGVSVSQVPFVSGLITRTDLGGAFVD
ncbi:MAG: peptidase S9, partial [Gemmatimonadales bacterium]